MTTQERIDQALAQTQPEAHPSAPAAQQVSRSSALGELLPPIRKPSPGDRDKLEQLRQQRLQLRAKRQAEAEMQLRSFLTGPSHQRMLDAALKSNTLCALLLGPTGCGKTSVARYLVRHHRAYWVRAIDLSAASQRHGLGEGVPPEIEIARSAGALVIDDIGQERDTLALYDVLDWRYARNLPTIATSGLTLEALTAHIGAEKVRRIAEQHVPGMKVLHVNCHRPKP
jgi:DNA replication protein DnaC